MRRALRLLPLALLVLAASAGPERPALRIADPYAGGGGAWYRGQLHAHSTTHQYWCRPESLRDKVERYRDAGFDFVSITDHNFELSGADHPYAVLPTRDPGVPGILFISGAEIAFLLAGPEDAPRAVHLGGVGMDWSVERGDSLFRLAATQVSTIQGAIDSIRTLRWAEDREALAILNHPEAASVRLPPMRLYPSDLAGLRDQAGIEIYNTFWSRRRPGGLAWQHLGTSHWDFLLVRGQGMRWGFATDDAHFYEVGRDFLGGWVLVQAESLATAPLLDAVQQGRFVACVDLCEGAARDTTAATFRELGVRGKRIVAASDRPTEFTWWTDAGHLVRTTRGRTRDEYVVEGWERYVRVRLRNAAGAAYSQPFFVDNPERDPDRWRLRREPGTRLLLHFDEGEGPVAADASGGGHSLLLDPAPPPPPSEWRDLADTTAYRDAPWGGWLPNGVGSTPDETDLDRDREGWAIVCHDRSLRGEIPVLPGSALLVEGAMTLEWIGRVNRRTAAEQPLVVHESRDASGRVRGWRLVAAEASADAVLRFRIATEEGGPIAVGIPAPADDVALVAVVVEPRAAGVAVRAYVDGVRASAAEFPGARVAWRRGGEEPWTIFADPFAPASCFAYLRELRFTAGARSEAALRADAQRLGLAAAGEAAKRRGRRR